MSEPPVAPESPQTPNAGSLLAQMEQMLAALSADLVRLDAEMQPLAVRADEEGREDGSFTSEAGRA